MAGIFEFHEFEDLDVPAMYADEEQRRRLMASIAALMFTQRAEVFNHEGGNKKWAPLAPSTYRRRLSKVPRRQQGKPDAVKILQSSGMLRQSFTPETGKGNAYREQTTDSEMARITSHVPYAAIHNFGGTIQIPEIKNGFGRGITIPAHSVTIPARPFDEFRPVDLAEIVEMIENGVDG